MSGVRISSLLVYALLAVVRQGSALTCLHCGEVDKPRYCTTVVQCSDNEVCSVKRTRNEFGDVVYSLGCQAGCENSPATDPADHCNYCCSGDLCNNQGCGESGYPSVRGPVCYNCESRLPGRCHDVEFCDPGQVCRVVGHNIYGETLLTSECAFNHTCNDTKDPGHGTGSVFVVGKRSGAENTFPHNRQTRASHTCEKCCTTDVCNQDCPTTHGQAMTTMGHQNPTTTQPWITTTPIRGMHWGPWSPWGVCNSSCNGTMSRTRTCMQMDGDLTCPGNARENKTCTIRRPTCGADGPYDCLDILNRGQSQGSGEYTLCLRTGIAVRVYCDMTTEGGGWTVFQNRYDGSVDFYQTFCNYENGFGFLNTEFWLGLQYVQEMTSHYANNKLRIDLEDANGTHGFDEYEGFRLSAGPHYAFFVDKRLSYQGMEGRHSLADRGSNDLYGNSFSTFDKDQDRASTSCARQQHSGWWYAVCYNFAHLNGRYLTPGVRDTHGIIYGEFDNSRYLTLKTSSMMFKGVN